MMGGGMLLLGHRRRLDGHIGRRGGEGVVELALWMWLLLMLVLVLSGGGCRGSRIGVRRLGRGEDRLDAQLGSNRDGGLGRARDPLKANNEKKKEKEKEKT